MRTNGSVEDQKTVKAKWLLPLAIIVSILTYNLWEPVKEYFEISIYYVGIALFFTLLSIF